MFCHQYHFSFVLNYFNNIMFKKRLIIGLLFLISTKTNAQFYGGSGDGYAFNQIQNINLPHTNVARGGSGDGFAFNQIQSFTQPLINVARGGSGDGFATNQISAVNLPTTNVSLGGIGDGFASAALVYNCYNPSNPYSVWNGEVSISWDIPANWDCSKLPDGSSRVIIPSFKTRYPTIYYNTDIKSISIMPGATLNVRPAIQFNINGQ